MPYESAIFFIVATVAAVFGFSNLAPDVADIAKLMCLGALVLAGTALLDARSHRDRDSYRSTPPA